MMMHRFCDIILGTKSSTEIFQNSSSRNLGVLHDKRRTGGLQVDGVDRYALNRRTGVVIKNAKRHLKM